MTHLLMPAGPSRGGIEVPPQDPLLMMPGLRAAFWPRQDATCRSLGGAVAGTRRVSMGDPIDPCVLWRSRGGASNTQASGTTWSDARLPGQRVAEVASGVSHGRIETYRVESADNATLAGVDTAAFDWMPGLTGGIGIVMVARYETDAFNRMISITDYTRWISGGPRGLTTSKWWWDVNAHGVNTTANYLLLDTGPGAGSWHMIWMDIEWSTGVMRSGCDSVSIDAAVTKTWATDGLPRRVRSIVIGGSETQAGPTPIQLGPVVIFDRIFSGASLLSIGTGLADRAAITLE